MDSRILEIPTLKITNLGKFGKNAYSIQHDFMYRYIKFLHSKLYKLHLYPIHHTTPRGEYVELQFDYPEIVSKIYCSSSTF